MSNIENTGLLESWFLHGRNWDNNSRIYGKVESHMRDGRPGPWNSDKDLVFGIKKDLYRQNPNIRQKGDIIQTSSSIFVLGNPRD